MWDMVLVCSYHLLCIVSLDNGSFWQISVDEYRYLLQRYRRLSSIQKER